MYMVKEHAIMMYYHTALRNVGLFTTLSFGSLGYSRFYRGKLDIYNLYLIVMSIVFILVSLTINWFLIIDYEIMVEQTDTVIADKWAFVPRLIFVFNLGIFVLGFYTLFREIKK